ncbi:MAG TPA: shikimate dehydrogenase [Spirochaeta sp.]|nr:shikimate dehydrogenase [Spirochaeta sp.]
MSENYKDELVGVFGHPVAENPTIIMQEAAFEAKNLKWRYLTIEVMPEDLETAVDGIRAMNMRGMNLTIPHKVEVLKYLDRIMPDAGLIGAVNTIRNEDGILIGENTDGKGFMRSLRDDAGFDSSGKEFVILGAGGAARAIGVELAIAGAGRITVVNRTESRGEELARLINEKTDAEAVFVKWEPGFSISVSTDVLVNATSIGLYPDVDAEPDIDYSCIKDNMIVCDVIPNPPYTPFLERAAEAGAVTLNGLGMLVYQGAIGFKMWTGVDAPVEVMHDALAEVFKG